MVVDGMIYGLILWLISEQCFEFGAIFQCYCFEV